MLELCSLIVAAGLPEPEVDYRFHPVRKWRFDLAWPEIMCAVEIEGGTWTGGRHVRGKGYEKDCEKYNEAALRGWLVLRFTTAMVRDGRALAAIERLNGLRLGENKQCPVILRPC